MAQKSTKKPKSDDISKVYLFTGEMDARRQTAVDRILSRALDAGSADFDLERFDGNAADAQSIIASAMTFPFTSEKKVVIVNRVDRLSADDQSRIAAFIPKLPDRSCLILLSEDNSDSKRKSGSAAAAGKESPAEDAPEQPKKGKGLRTELTNAVKKNGEVVAFAKLKKDGVRALVQQAVSAQGKKIESSAVEALVLSVEASPSLIDREVEKLATYIGDRDTIRAVDVDALITRSPEDRVFRVIDAVADGQPEQAIRLLEETFDAGTKPDSEAMKVLALIARQFRLLYQTRFLMEQGVRNLDSVSDDLRSFLMREVSPVSVHPFQKERLIRQARVFSLGELETCLKHVLECELAVKGLSNTAISPRMSLEMLVLKLSHRQRRN